MKKPIVSAIITTYNRADTVERAIQSVLDQSEQNFEIVIVDDASTDNTVEAIKQKFPDKRIKIICNKKNMGIGGAKNVGVENAAGKYIAFLDSDDAWLPNKLEAQLKHMQDDPHKFPLSFTGFYVYRENLDRIVIRQPKKQRTWLESLLYGETFSLGSTLIATKECFETVGPFNVNLRRMQDRDWSIRYFDHYHSFSFLPEPLANIHNSGWPEADTVESSIKALFKANEERLSRRGKYYSTLVDVSLRFEAAVAQYRSGSKLKAIKEIARILYTRPSFLSYMSYRLIRKVKQKDAA